MKISEDGICLIKSFEGCRLCSYLCPAGVWTIGYGHTQGVMSGQMISQEKAEEYLKSDLERYEEYVQRNVPMLLTQGQFDALVSFTYNCGVSNLKSLVRNRSLEEIGQALLLYNRANGKVLQGLVRRRKAEQELYLTSEEVSIVSALKRRGADSSYSNRALLAKENGIIEYRGSAAQNMQLLALLKQGKLKGIQSKQ